jgi:hypothetical protein
MMPPLSAAAEGAARPKGRRLGRLRHFHDDAEADEIVVLAITNKPEAGHRPAVSGIVAKGPALQDSVLACGQALRINGAP